MPRYYVDTDDGDAFVGDAEGRLLNSAEDAVRLAHEALLEMARDRSAAIEERVYRASVRDQRGRVLYQTTLTLADRHRQALPAGRTL